MVKVLLKLMAWGKAHTAVAVGAGVLLAAAGTATVAVNVLGTSADDLIAQLERSSGKRIAWDKHLELSAALDLKRLSLEQALDDLSVHSGAYWTIDYAVYGNEQALQRLLESLHEGTELQTAGWTNLSARPLRANILIQPGDRNLGGGGSRGGGGGSGGGTGGAKHVVSDLVSMIVVLQGSALAKWEEAVQQNLARQAQGEQNVRGTSTRRSPPSSSRR